MIYRCDECPETFRDLDDLRDHVGEVHANTAVQSKLDDVVDLEFTTADQLLEAER